MQLQWALCTRLEVHKTRMVKRLVDILYATELSIARCLHFQTDVIVNMTSSNLNLEQGVASRALLAKGGTTIQEDLNTKYSNGIKEGEIAVSNSGNLSCKDVYHITMSKRKRGGHEVCCFKSSTKRQREFSELKYMY